MPRHRSEVARSERRPQRVSRCLPAGLGCGRGCCGVRAIGGLSVQSRAIRNRPRRLSRRWASRCRDAPAGVWGQWGERPNLSGKPGLSGTRRARSRGRSPGYTRPPSPSHHCSEWSPRLHPRAFLPPDRATVRKAITAARGHMALPDGEQGRRGLRS